MWGAWRRSGSFYTCVEFVLLDDFLLVCLVFLFLFVFFFRFGLFTVYHSVGTLRAHLCTKSRAFLARLAISPVKHHSFFV